MVDDPATKLPTAAQPRVIPRPTPNAAMRWARTLSAGLQPKAGPRCEGQGSIPHPPRRRRPAPLLLAAALAALPRLATAQSPLAAPTAAQLAPAPATVSATSAPAPCDQARLEGVAPPSPRAYAFAPRSQVRPFYQWLNNNGYCGEVSLLAAGLANGQWISQFNARSIASPFPLFPQTGKPSGINFYSQMLLDDLAKPGTTTANSFGQAASWMRLDAVAYPSATQATGAAGARHFLAWIKARIVAGDQVTLGVIDALDRSLPYSHIVSVVRIESNYPAGDTAYHADDVLYVEDHGLITLPGANPAIPPGTTGTSDCTPFVFGYTFANWTSPVSSQRIYGIPVPGGRTRNYAYAIPGVQDPQRSTLPVRLEILSNGYPANPIAGYQYEAPMIGKSAYGASNTNTPPAPTTLVLRATVSGLVPGATYNLYLYRTAARPLAGPWPSLPTANFNANASLATNRISFTATADTYSVTVTVPSSSSVAFRAVSSLAP